MPFIQLRQHNAVFGTLSADANSQSVSAVALCLRTPSLLPAARNPVMVELSPAAFGVTPREINCRGAELLRLEDMG